MTEHFPERNARIRQLYAEGWKPAAIAAEIGCRPYSVWAVINPEKHRAHAARYRTAPRCPTCNAPIRRKPDAA